VTAVVNPWDWELLLGAVWVLLLAAVSGGAGRGAAVVGPWDLLLATVWLLAAVWRRCELAQWRRAQGLRLQDLPPEILVFIVNKLDQSSDLAAALTSRPLHQAVRDDRTSYHQTGTITTEGSAFESGLP
jgi:hypothetical protein